MKIKKITKLACIIILIGLLFIGLGYMTNQSFSFESSNKLNITKTNEYKIVKDIKELEEFKSINIEVGITNIEIIPYEKYKIELQYKEDYGKINYKVKNNSLIINQESTIRNLNNKSNFNKDDLSFIKIYIPSDKSFEKFSIISDIGNIDIRQMNLNNLDLSCNVGNIKVNNCEINKSKFKNLEANLNLGNINSKNINVKNLLNTKNDLGNIDISGKVYGDIEVNCDLGNVDIEIDEKEKNYNYRLICDLGKIDINGKRKNKDVSLENNSDNNLNIECDSGNIKLKFKK
ncbi:hypothetical protein UMC2_07651 [[Clostridium] sordellii]|uniref:DUF4097 family beta strand repeat-containing protein n=1 Tax=Paraclostridium sordellii TaxID=1505 RepID=UPI000544273C|nr:DUF4097 family beta strand repeat-containing protein [Paeniclostridium sordellii]CEK33515.1 hypothetical protein UMC2_07651 [[Clostridium] sordellii] [Paeniclostridium sordellii]